jgi:histidinol-phosphate aminotransferase
LPTYRADLTSIPRYVPGKPIDDVARELGIDSIDKLASNECPEAPFPEVVEAIAIAGASVNRYPDSAGYELTRAIARHHGIEPESVWIGAGSSEILRCTALAVGGPETSAVFASPSFIMYTISTMISGAEPIMVPLTDSYEHDLEAMHLAVRDDTTIVYVCNPNNPTGGIRSGDEVRSFIRSLPDRVTVIVDEAYAEYVTDPGYVSLLSEATTTLNVVVARTFSKIYGLAGLRVGYGVGEPDLIASLRTTQPPFSVNAVAQAAAIVALNHQERVAERRDANARGRTMLLEGLRMRGIEVADSQANFVYYEPSSDPAAISDALLQKGVIVRPLGPGVRVTVGTEAENQRFLNAVDALGTAHV